MNLAVLHKSNIYARIEKNISETYVLFSNDGYDALNKFKETLYKFYTEPKEEKNNIYKIYSDNTGFHLNKGHIKEVKDFNIGLQYNDDFPHEDEKIKKFINHTFKYTLKVHQIYTDYFVEIYRSYLGIILYKIIKYRSQLRIK